MKIIIAQYLDSSIILPIFSLRDKLFKINLFPGKEVSEVLGLVGKISQPDISQFSNYSSKSQGIKEDGNMEVKVNAIVDVA